MSFVEWLAVGANIASIVGLVVNLKQFNMRAIFINPYIKVFGVSLAFTALVFLVPWNRIHIDSNTPAQKQIIVHDTITKITNKPILELTPIEKNQTVVSSQKVKIVYVPINLKKQSKKDLKISDTTSKNQIANTGNNNQSAIGNNNQVGKNNFNGGNGLYSTPVHVGDNINTSVPSPLTEDEILYIFNETEKILNIDKLPKKLMIASLNYTNAVGFSNQLTTYFKQKGYKVTPAFAMLDAESPVIKGIKLILRGKELTLYIGIIEDKPQMP